MYLNDGLFAAIGRGAVIKNLNFTASGKDQRTSVSALWAPARGCMLSYQVFKAIIYPFCIISTQMIL